MKYFQIPALLFALIPISAVAKCERSGFDEFGRRAFICDAPLSLSSPKVREALIDILKNNGVIVGNQCGFVGLGDRAAPALTCATAEAQKHHPFWLAFQGDSWDSEVWTVAALNADGSGIYFSFDSNPSGGDEIEPVYTVQTCRKLAIHPEHYQRFWCAD